jgi:chemotaxis protein MotB
VAILRRNGGQVSGSIWPGFVDAMTALLMILMFVLTIFMVVQFVLRETITGQDEELNNMSDLVAVQDTELDNLSIQLAGLAEALGLEQTRTKGLQGELSNAQGELQTAQDLVAQQTIMIGSLTATAEQQKTRIASFEEQVAGLLGQRDDLTGKLANTQAALSEVEAAQAKTLSEKEAVQLALAQARDEIDLQTEQARLAAAKREAMQALIANLNKDITAKDTQMKTIANDLEEIEKQRLAEIAAVVALQERLKSAQDELTTLQTDVADKQSELAQTKTALSEEEKLRLIEMAAAKELRERLKNSQDELTAMTLALEAKRKGAENTLTLLAAAQAAKIAAVDLADQRLSDREKEAALLAQANNLLKDEQALSAESQRKVALLNQQTNVLRGQLDTLQGLLDDANAKDLNAKIQIESLGTNLNTALARVAAEQKQRAALEEAERKRLEAEAVDLKKFRSEFFGRLREVLGTQEGIRIVGDRFVFSSEILYTTGSAQLGARGKEEIRKVANIIKDIAGQIPEEIDWILRVDGHTDNTPIRGFGEYTDNWELSQARALAVVKYLINDLGVPAKRLSANGFGEFQPIAEGDSPEALAANRRIELKFTEK